MEKKEELEFHDTSFEGELESLRTFGNDTRGIAREALEKIEALTNALKEKGAIPPAYSGPPKYGPPKYPPIKTKEECEKKGGEWDDEKKTCTFPKKETTEGRQGLGILPSSNLQLGELSDRQADAIAVEKFGKERGWKTEEE